MGIDKSLNDNYPSVIINGTRYHFGRHPGPDDAYFLVENASYAKDYWWFEHEDDFLAFLVNLPQSADRQRHLKLHPDWHDVTHEQRDAYIEGDRARLREMMAAKRRAGVARAFPVYPDDGSGPYGDREPIRIAEPSTEPPMLRVERQLREEKARRRPTARKAGTRDLITAFLDYSFESGLSEAGKLAVLERLDWDGINPAEKEAILAREVVFSEITDEQFAFIYEDLVADKYDPPDQTPARKLFEAARNQGTRRTDARA